MRKAVSTLQDFSDHDMVQFFLRPQIITRTLAGVLLIGSFCLHSPYHLQGQSLKCGLTTCVHQPWEPTEFNLGLLDSFNPIKNMSAWIDFLELMCTFFFHLHVKIFSLTVFASLVNEGYQNLVTSSELHCVLNENDAACCYGITVGALSFFQSLLFLGFDIFDSTVTSYKFKYAILVLDVTFSIIWTGLWSVGFCFLAHQWNRSTHHYLLGASAARASITFAFFSIPCWVYLACLALKNLWAEPPIPYKRSLDEGSVALTTLSSSTTTSFPSNVGYPENVGTASYPSTPVPNRLTLMNTDG